MKRVWSVLIALMLVLGMSGCDSSTIYGTDGTDNQLGAYSNTNGAEEKEMRPARESISMVFYEDMDMNPLTTTNSENHELLKLIYSPLVRLNSALVAEYVLAEQITTEGTDATIVLREGLQFSDGSAVTAADVAASFKTIRNTPTSPYYTRLENLKSWRAADDRTLMVTLKAPDVDFISRMDIPVMQQKGDAGCGPYCFSEINGKRVLVPNTSYFTQPTIQTIYLKKPADNTERQNMFSVGLLDVYFVPAESDLVFSGGKNYQVQTYASDNLLYLGVNCQNGLLSRAEIRAYLNGLLDREKITDGVLLGQAQETAYPFQATWYKADGLEQEKNWSDAARKEKAQAVGLQVSENALLDESGNQLTFSLLVDAGSIIHRNVAQAVADSFAMAGVKINVEAVSTADYNTRLQTGQYALYLGEVKTGRTLNPALYTTASPVNYGGFSAPELEQAAADYQTGNLSLSAFAHSFDQYTPIFPLAYRDGVLFVASDIGLFQSTGPWAVYGDITKLKTTETEIKE